MWHQSMLRSVAPVHATGCGTSPCYGVWHQSMLQSVVPVHAMECGTSPCYRVWYQSMLWSVAPVHATENIISPWWYKSAVWSVTPFQCVDCGTSPCYGAGTSSRYGPNHQPLVQSVTQVCSMERSTSAWYWKLQMLVTLYISNMSRWQHLTLWQTQNI